MTQLASYEFVPINQFVNSHPHWTEFVLGLSVAVVSTALIGSVVWLYRALGQSTALRVGAGWEWEGPDPQPGYMRLHPVINVMSRSNAPKKIVHSIWVRESKNIYKPGKIYGKIDLVDQLAVEKRTTGGDPLNFSGPTIKCEDLKAAVEKVMNCPIWVQTTDNRWYKAQSMGNPPGLAEQLRLKLWR
jgi:hypothetical protein